MGHSGSRVVNNHLWIEKLRNSRKLENLWKMVKIRDFQSFSSEFTLEKCLIFHFVDRCLEAHFIWKKVLWQWVLKKFAESNLVPREKYPPSRNWPQREIYTEKHRKSAILRPRNESFWSISRQKMTHFMQKLSIFIWISNISDY